MMRPPPRCCPPRTSAFALRARSSRGTRPRTPSRPWSAAVNDDAGPAPAPAARACRRWSGRTRAMPPPPSRRRSGATNVSTVARPAPPSSASLNSAPGARRRRTRVPGRVDDRRAEDRHDAAERRGLAGVRERGDGRRRHPLRKIASRSPRKTASSAVAAHGSPDRSGSARRRCRRRSRRRARERRRAPPSRATKSPEPTPRDDARTRARCRRRRSAGSRSRLTCRRPGTRRGRSRCALIVPSGATRRRRPDGRGGFGAPAISARKATRPPALIDGSHRAREAADGARRRSAARRPRARPARSERHRRRRRRPRRRRSARFDSDRTERQRPLGCTLPPPIAVKSPPDGLALPDHARPRACSCRVAAKSPSRPPLTVARNPRSPAVVTPRSRNAAYVPPAGAARRSARPRRRRRRRGGGARSSPSSSVAARDHGVGARAGEHARVEGADRAAAGRRRCPRRGATVADVAARAGRSPRRPPRRSRATTTQPSAASAGRPDAGDAPAVEQDVARARSAA